MLLKVTLKFPVATNPLFKGYFKEGLQSVLRVVSAHNKGGLLNINIVQILHFSNSF